MIRASAALLALTLAFLAFTARPATAGPLEDGQKALAEEAWADAAAAFQKVLAKTPDHPDAAVGLAKALVGAQSTDQDAYATAESALLDVIEAHPKSENARHALGELYIAMARAKAGDPSAMRNILVDAGSTFQALLDENPADAEAAVGLARSHYESAEFDAALQVLDDFLAGHKDTPKAWYWKGKVYYLKGLDAYRNSGQLDDEAKSLFGQAQGAFMTAAKLDATDFDAWVQLGYAAQYLQHTDEAQDAYEKAMDLDPHSMVPLKGIEALYLYQPDVYPKTLQALIRKHPTNVAIHFFAGYNALKREAYDEALHALETYVSKASDPGVAWVYLASAYAGKGDTANAQKYYRKALEYNPADAVAADGIDRYLRDKHMGLVAQSPANAMAMVKDYEGLFALAPDYVWGHNNAAFLLRDAVDKHKGDKAWKPVLDECVKLYLESSKLTDKAIASLDRTWAASGGIPYPTRFSYAGIYNDTGLMFQYYPSIRDLERAEEYYLEAMRLSEDGLGDTFKSLERIYTEQERYQDLYDLAKDCAESLRNSDGSPDMTSRAHARGVMQNVESKLDK